MRLEDLKVTQAKATRVARGAVVLPLGRRCGLRGIGVALGELQTMEALRPRLEQPQQQLLDELKRYGVYGYRYAEDPVLELAERAALATLAQTGLSGKELDLILLATEAGGGEAFTKGLATLCTRLGAANTPLAVVSGHECSNLGLALGQAAAEVSSGWVRRVLVISADRCPSDAERLCTPPIALMSDGAVACIVDSQAAPSLALLSLRSVFDHRLLGHAHASLAQHVQVMLMLFGRAAADILGPSAQFQTPQRLFTNNVSQALLDMVGRIYKLPAHAVCSSNLASHGHLYGADPLVSCSEYLTDAGRAGGAQLGLLFFGRASAVFVLVECQP